MSRLVVWIKQMRVPTRVEGGPTPAHRTNVLGLDSLCYGLSCSSFSDALSTTFPRRIDQNVRPALAQPGFVLWIPILFQSVTRSGTGQAYQALNDDTVADKWL